MEISITKGTRGPLPRVPFSVIAKKVLGPRYALSVMLIGDARMRTLNRTHRGKDTTTDILSFPLEKDFGEIFISEHAAAKKASVFGLSKTQYLTYVFIHGLLHLKGMEHGRTMEKQEDLWCEAFGVPIPKR